MLRDQLQAYLDRCNLKPYGAARFAGAELDLPIKTLHRRLIQYIREDYEALAKFEETMNAIGLDVILIPKPDNQFID